MKDEDILRRAIEKAVENGYKIPQHPCLRENYPIDYVIAIENKHYFSNIFSHDFAKAFWGDKEICNRCYSRELDLEDGVCYGCIKNGHGTILLWKYHLQQMVLEKSPLKYLEKYLERHLGKG